MESCAAYEHFEERIRLLEDECADLLKTCSGSKSDCRKKPGKGEDPGEKYWTILYDLQQLLISIAGRADIVLLNTPQNTNHYRHLTYILQQSLEARKLVEKACCINF